MRRRIALVVAALCGVGGVLLAVLPYTGRVSFHPGQMVTGGAGIVGSKGMEGDCESPIISSWHEGSGAWVVETEKRNDGYARMESLGALCRPSARKRLLASLGLGVLVVGGVLIGRRIHPPATPPAEPASF